MQQAYIPPPPAHHYHTLRSIQSNKLILLMSLSPLISLILSTFYFPNVNPTPPLPSHSSHLISHHVMHFPLPIDPTSTPFPPTSTLTRTSLLPHHSHSKPEPTPTRDWLLTPAAPQRMPPATPFTSLASHAPSSASSTKNLARKLDLV